MKRIFLRGCLSAAMVLGACAAWGGPPSISWQEALDAAWQRARERPEGAGELERARAERTAADTPWAAPPSLELDHRSGRDPGNGSARESEVGVMWPLWLPGQKQSRLDAGDASVLAAQRAQDAARLRLAGELRQSALSVGAHEAELRQAELEVRLLQALADDVERRVRAGDLARADALAANAEVLQARANLLAAAQRLQQARDQWQLLTGRSALPAPAPAPGAAPAGEHPELMAVAARIERARRRLDTAERSRRDPPEVGVKYRRATDNSGAANSIGIALRIPFAGDARNAPLLAQARGDFDVAVAEEQRLRERLSLEQDAARRQLDSAALQLDAERSRAGLLRQRAELIDKAFRAGESALPDLLRALAAAAQADAAVTRQQAVRAQAQGRLSQALGLFP